MMRKQTFSLMDINRNVPVRSLYNTPVCLSAKAAKQKILAGDSLLALMIFALDGGHHGMTSILGLKSLSNVLRLGGADSGLALA